eukprot:scpid105230/ scgid17481/ 
MLASTSLPVGYGVAGSNARCLIYGFSTPMLLRIVLPQPPLCMAAINARRGEDNEERTREVKRTSFVPVVMSASGGTGKAATVLYKRWVAFISEKRNDQYSATMARIRTRLCF